MAVGTNKRLSPTAPNVDSPETFPAQSGSSLVEPRDSGRISLESLYGSVPPLPGRETVDFEDQIEEAMQEKADRILSVNENAMVAPQENSEPLMTLDTSASIWQGKLVRLRAIEPGDWETYYAWNQDDEMTRSLDWVWFPQSREAMRQQAQRESVKEREGDNFDFVIENEAGEVVGSIGTHLCDPRTGTFAYGISTRSDHKRKGYAAEAIRLVLRYYFKERRYQKVTVGVYSFNEASIRLHQKLGFQEEGRLRRMGFTNGAYFDILQFGLTVEEFEALLSQDERRSL